MAKKNLDLYDPNAPKPFIITVSSRALYDLEESNDYFQKYGEKKFEKYQLELENEPLEPGAAHSIIRKILNINEILPDGARPFEVVLLSRNSPETGLRVFNTIERDGLNIFRAVFTSGESPSNYLDAIGVDLMLSTNPLEVKKAIDRGVAAATLMPKSFTKGSTDTQIKIAFDGDAVLFSDEAEKVHHDSGLAGFREHEKEKAHLPLEAGPFRGFLEVIHELQKCFPPGEDCPIRTALITARSAPAHKRAILTLRDWGVRVDNAMFLGGKDKGPYLKAFKADLFLDDSKHNVENAISHVPSGHVPYGIRNAPEADEINFSGSASVEAKKTTLKR